jgi:hypothetical protein
VAGFELRESLAGRSRGIRHVRVGSLAWDARMLGRRGCRWDHRQSGFPGDSQPPCCPLESMGKRTAWSSGENSAPYGDCVGFAESRWTTSECPC